MTELEQAEAILSAPGGASPESIAWALTIAEPSVYWKALKERRRKEKEKENQK